MPDQSFNDVIKGCKMLDRKAQRTMMDRLTPFLLALCRRYEHTHENARDAVQEALILIFNNIDACIPQEKPFFGWCKRIAINVCLGRIRRKRVSWENLDDTLPQPVHPEIMEQLDAESILQLLQKLPENQRLAFNLYVIDGYSHAEIGQIMGLQESHSRTLLTRARATLQSFIHHQPTAVSNAH
jgi:RNA polymerase sigma factor (sigma-70 family)